MRRTREDLYSIWTRVAGLAHGFPFEPTAESKPRFGEAAEAIQKALIALDPDVQPYTIPGGDVISVDKDLDISVLDRLNTLPGMEVVSTCAGHRGRNPHLVLRMGESVFVRTQNTLREALGHTTTISTSHDHSWAIHLEGLYPRRTRRQWWLEITRLLETAARTAPGTMAPAAPATV